MPAVTLRLAQGTPCWMSLLTDDLEGARAFYGRLFDWEYSPGPARIGPYVRARSGGEPVAGLGVSPGAPGHPVGWTTYFAADHADEAGQRVRECGGTVAVGPVQAGGAGRLAIAADVSGAVFGLWQGEEHLGWEPTGEPGTPAATELLTPDPSGARAFYRAVLAYEVRDRTAPGADPGTSAGPPDGPSGADACELLVSGRPVAGIRRTGGRAPARWRACFTVADPDRTAALAVAAGGRTVPPPGRAHRGSGLSEAGHTLAHGRLVHLTDPRGGLFSVLGPA